MNATDALIERVALDLCNAEVCMCDPIDGMNSSCISKLRIVATALGVSKEVLCWIAANPDTAAALAVGTMVGVPMKATPEMRSAGGYAQQQSIGSYGEPDVVWRAMLAAVSTLAPSDEGLGGTDG